MIKILMIEDDRYFSDAQKMKLEMNSNVSVVVYKDFESFVNEHESPEDAEKYYCALLDYQFGMYDAWWKGTATYLKKDLQFKGKVFLWTLERLEDVKGKDQYDHILPKKFYSLEDLERF